MSETQVVTLGEVEAAFETLLEVVGRECDGPTTQTVYFAKVDVLAILAGEWTDATAPAQVGRLESAVGRQESAVEEVRL